VRYLLEILVFIVLTTFFIGSLIAIASHDDVLDTWLNTLLYVTCCSAAILPPVLLMIRKLRRIPRLVFYFCIAVVVELGAYGGALLATHILEGDLQFWNEGIGYSVLSSFYVFGAIAGYYALRDDLARQMKQLQQAQMAREQAKRHELQAKLNSIQAKLNPHFLFNCLNTVAALIGVDPPRAEEYTVKLAEVYRRVLSISDRTFIPLAEELDLIRDVVELERQRFGERLTLVTSCPEELQGWPISGLLIEPLVENAIKHNRDRDALRIDLRVEQADGFVTIKVEDDGGGFTPGAQNRGFGLTGVRERLQLLYGTPDLLCIESAPGQGSRLTLRLPIQPPILEAIP
jgi:sensor histidine kinase YesM